MNNDVLLVKSDYKTAEKEGRLSEWGKRREKNRDCVLFLKENLMRNSFQLVGKKVVGRRIRINVKRCYDSTVREYCPDRIMMCVAHEIIPTLKTLEAVEKALADPTVEEWRKPVYQWAFDCIKAHPSFEFDDYGYNPNFTSDGEIFVLKQFVLRGYLNHEIDDPAPTETAGQSGNAE